MAEPTWAQVLAAAIGARSNECDHEITRVRVRTPESVDVEFRLTGNAQSCALHVCRGWLAGGELLAPDDDAERLAFYTIELGINEPHDPGDFDVDEAGVRWLRPAAWML